MLLAVTATALTVACVSGGLIVVAPAFQIGVLAALIAGLIAPDVRLAALSGALGCALGLLLGPTSAWVAITEMPTRLSSGLLSVAVAGGTAAGVRYLAVWRSIVGRIAFWAAVVLVVGNLWATTYDANRQSFYEPVSGVQMPPFNEQLRGSIPDVIADSDEVYWYRLLIDVRSGEDYYRAMAAALDENPAWQPGGVADFRMPTLYYLWKLLPSLSALVPTFLAVATAGILMLVPVAKGFVRLPLVIPAAAALASYFLSFSVQFTLIKHEVWAVTLGLASFGAYAVSVRSDRWKAFAVLSVVAAVAATLIRETIAFLPLAGLASAFLFEGEERRFRVVAWATGFVALGVAYAAHALAARPYIAPAVEASRLGKGSLAAVWSAITYGTNMLGSGYVLPAVLVVLGVAGAVLLRDRCLRAFVLGTTLATLASFLVLGNGAWSDTTGAAVNYWGVAVVPLIYATVPMCFTLVPGAAVPAAARPA